MEIRLGSLLAGAREAVGTVVLIDVYRAFTTAPVMFLRGAEKIVMVGEVKDALELKRRGAGDLCVGEIGGTKPDGFDHGNSPFEMTRVDLAGKTIIQSTRAGTVGVEAACRADRIYGGSLVMAEATAAAILEDDPAQVTLVAMGWEGHTRTDEDEQCGLYLRNLLQGRSPDVESVRSLVLSGEESQKFGDPGKPQFHPRDRDIALRINSVPFAVSIAREDGLLTARPRQVETKGTGECPSSDFVMK